MADGGSVHKREIDPYSRPRATVQDRRAQSRVFVIVLVVVCALLSYGLAYGADAADGRIDGVASTADDAYQQNKDWSQGDDSASDSNGAATDDSATAANSASADSSAAGASAVSIPDDWQTGKCTAYDPVSIGYSGQTASGIMLDNGVPTIAAPVEHRELLGTRVVLCYNQQIVVTTITDLGEFAPYGVAFDFAPGTFMAFGYSSAETWGAHEVLYRYLD